MTEWYLVKTNWDATERRCPGYLGLGGDVWPLDDSRRTERGGTAVHERLMRSRVHVDMGGYEELVCCDLHLAEAYADVARNVLMKNVILVRVSLATPGEDPWQGIDIGTPSGGFSLVETNVINQRHGACLNQLGLFSSIGTLNKFFESYGGEVEEGDFATVRIASIKS